LAFGNSRWLGHSLAIWEFALALAPTRIWEIERWQAPTQAEKTPEKKYRKNTSPILGSSKPEQFLSDS
jgi:hypothetical protein